MKLRFSAVFASLVLVGLLSASPAFAAPFVLSTVTELADGTFHYEYDLSNLFNLDASLDENIYDFGITFSGAPLRILAPENWDFFSGEEGSSGPGYINWFAPQVVDDVTGGVTSPFDLLAGQSLRGFSFESILGPGNIEFTTVGVNLQSGDAVNGGGVTTGPTARVPEPSTLSLFGAAGLVAWFAQRRRSLAS